MISILSRFCHHKFFYDNNFSLKSFLYAIYIVECEIVMTSTWITVTNTLEVISSVAIKGQIDLDQTHQFPL